MSTKLWVHNNNNKNKYPHKCNNNNNNKYRDTHRGMDKGKYIYKLMDICKIMEILASINKTMEPMKSKEIQLNNNWKQRKSQMSQNQKNLWLNTLKIIRQFKNNVRRCSISLKQYSKWKWSRRRKEWVIEIKWILLF